MNTPHKFADQFNEIADTIEAHKERFDMGFWMQPPGKMNRDNDYIGPKLDLLKEEHYCGTVACIGGFADAISLSKNVTRREYLPLNADEAEDLYYADSRYAGRECVWWKYAKELKLSDKDETLGKYTDDCRQANLEKITADMAITMLRNLASGKWTPNTY